MSVLEVCVDDPEGLATAIEGGADRIELCAALALGGLTPSPGLLAAARSAPVPVYVMIRPRAGDFVFAAAEINAMIAEIDHVRALGFAGVVLGASRPDGRLDTGTLAALCGRARGLGTTLHRAFDLVPDFAEAIELAVALGFERILTAGGAENVDKGLKALTDITRLAGNRISIMPGSGVTVTNAPELIARLGVRELHASGSRRRAADGGPAGALGFELPGRKITDADTIRALKSAMIAAQ
ncbi:copper homeostasis protein CutC [Pelagibacterium limicola]|uniref:copper homeostasis protein CutC n=1 Tax=Pelagibacterium limicola TaxID=2791022 RepID=UPI0018AF9910|nr:copper homeostasis protein CutC [Pelagibacterium limicola]